VSETQQARNEHAEIRIVDGSPILVARFEGSYEGFERRVALGTTLRELYPRFPEAIGVVVDVTRASLALHTYTPADFHACTDVFFEPLPWAWAASASSRDELDYDMRRSGGTSPEEWIFPSGEEALREVLRQVTASEVCFHDLDGGVRQRLQRGPRGVLIENVQQDGSSGETLYVGRASVETTRRDAKGEIIWRAQWPLRDATGAENEACRMEARLIYNAEGRLMLDFNPESTRRPLCEAWLSRLAAAQNPFGLDLSGTGATDRDVEAALDACPGLESLCLDHTKVTTRSLARFGEATRLRSLALDGCKISVRKLRALLKLRPELQVSGVWL